MSTDLLAAPAVAGSYDFVQIAPGQDIPNIVARLQLKASEVNQLLRERDPEGLTRYEFLYLFADTFVLDEQLPASFLNVVVRVFDARPTEHAHGGAAVLEVARHSEGIWGAVQLLVQDLLGNRFCIERAGRGQHYYVDQAIVAQRVPKVVTWQSADETFGKTSTEDARVAGVARQPHLCNVLKAQFAAACEWLEATVPAHRAEGLEALRWVVQCTQAMSTKPELAAEAGQLNYQAAALLLLASSAGGARHVPVWSEAYLKERIDQLLEVLHSYEEKAATLTIRGDMQQTVAALTQALSDVAGADEAALQVAADHNQQEIDDAWAQYHALSWAYELQESTVRVAFLEFKHQLDIKATLGTLTAVLEIVNLAGQVAAMYFGAALPPDPQAAATALANAQKEAARLVDKADDIGSLVMDAIKTDVIDYVKKLKSTLEKVAKYAKLAAEAAKKALEIKKLNQMAASATLAMPSLEGMGAFDPVLDWNLYIKKVELSLQDCMGGTGEKNPPVAGAKEYYFTLYTMAEYGKALSSKAVALMHLQGRALELEAQRNASRFAVERWQKLQVEAKSAEEKLSLAKSLLAEAALNTKRSLLVLDAGYRAAYFYNHLTEVPPALRLDMDYAAMRQAFVNIKRDLTGLFVKPQHTQRTTTRYLDLPVVKAGSQLPTKPHAVLTHLPGKKPTLSWSLPLRDPTLRPWLNEAKLKLFFVKEAWFELDGAKPDANNTITLEVTTTGNYTNGYSTESSSVGKPEPGRFISAGTSLEYSYDPAQPNEPFTPWCPVEIDRDNYMRPTPFTTWLATIEAGDVSELRTLRLKLMLDTLKLT